MSTTRIDHPRNDADTDCGGDDDAVRAVEEQRQRYVMTTSRTPPLSSSNGNMMLRPYAEQPIVIDPAGNNNTGIFDAKKRQLKRLSYLIALVGIAFLTTATIALTTARRRRRVTDNNNNARQPINGNPTTTTAGTTGVPTIMAPEIVELAKELSLAVPSTSYDDMITTGTAQNSALVWLAMDDTYSLEQGWSVDDGRFVQRYVLAVLYYALNGDRWKSCGRDDPICSSVDQRTKQSWLSGTDVCAWNMIRCGDGTTGATVTAWMTGTDVAGSIDVGMIGTIPAEISHLTALREINIRNERLQGPLVSYLSGMADLTVLNVKESDFTGTIPNDFVSNHPLLTELDLSGNAFQGRLPNDLDGLPNVKVLDLSDNALTGSIPSAIGSMAALTTLDLHNNKLTGDIPLTLYSLTHLVRLNLGDNSLAGTIADEIGGMSNLTQVSLGPSSMTGSLPSGLFTLNRLEILQLADSQFTGPLSGDDFIQIGTTITILDLENNDFVGPVPIAAWESYIVLEELKIAGNDRLTGTVTQTLCDKRGTFTPSIQLMEVGCNVLCAPGCCHDTGCDEIWVESQSELPP